MPHWHQPPEFHQPFWPSSGPAGEAAAAAAGGPSPHGGPSGFRPRYHEYHYGRSYHWRPRFGLLRRAIWFGLGVGFASWYIHHKREQKRIAPAIDYQHNAEYDPKTKIARGDNAVSWSWSWPPPSSSDGDNSMSSHGLGPTGRPIDPTQQPIEKKCGWSSRKQRQEATALEMEADQIKAAVEKAWADRRKEANVVQAKADDEARDSAKEKLEVLSKAIEKMRETLQQAHNGKDSKLV